MKRQTRVYLIDPQAIARNGLKTILSAQRNFCVVGESEQLCYELATIVETRPELLLVTLAIGDTDGLSAMTQIRQQLPHCKIVVLADAWQTGWVRACVNAGADAFQLKSVEPDTLLTVVQSLLGKSQATPKRMLIKAAQLRQAHQTVVSPRLPHYSLQRGFSAAPCC